MKLFHSVFLAKLLLTQSTETLRFQKDKNGLRLRRETDQTLRKLQPSQEVLLSIASVPKWIQEYVKWHTKERKLGSTDTKYLTVQTYKLRGLGGGISDRLKHLPYFLLLAYKTKRVLLIKWQTEMQLEDFLVPPFGGIDWRYSPELNFDERQNFHWRVPPKDDSLLEFWNYADQEERNLNVYANIDLYGKFKTSYFITDKKPNGVFSEIMSILFEPSEAIAQGVMKQMNDLGLKPKQYLSVQFRGSYGGMRSSEEEQSSRINNALNCVVKIGGNGTTPKIFFTADDRKYVTYATNKSIMLDNNEKLEIVTTNHEDVHSGKADTVESMNPIFIDLWLMKNSKCAAYGIGGYGLFGARLAGEECSINYRYNKCEPVSPDLEVTNIVLPYYPGKWDWPYVEM